MNAFKIQLFRSDPHLARHNSPSRELLPLTLTWTSDTALSASFTYWDHNVWMTKTRMLIVPGWYKVKIGYCHDSGANGKNTSCEGHTMISYNIKASNRGSEYIDHLVTMAPANGWDTFGRKWTVSSWSWWVWIRKNRQSKHLGNFDKGQIEMACDDPDDWVRESPKWQVVWGVLCMQWLVPTKSSPRKDTQWISDMGAQGSLMSVGSKVIPQKSYCRTNCWKSS